MPCSFPKPPPPDGSTLNGPAVTGLTGGADRQAFSLDSGGLVVQPPRQGDAPAVSDTTAECDALASVDPYGANFAGFGYTNGIAIGYARVTVRADLLDTDLTVQSDSGHVPARLAAPPVYRDRLAWVLVVHRVTVAACPWIPSGRRVSPQPARATDYSYQVFLLDAATGGGALDYIEGGPALCDGPGRLGPSTEVPTDWMSVPWTLASRDRDGYSARVTAQLTSCDGYDTLVLPDEDRPDYVRVLVDHPIGASCPPVRRTLALHAATVTSNLPAHLVHAPTGLWTPATVDTTPSPPPATGTLLQVDAAACGTTITVTTGTVLVLPSDSNAVGTTYPVRSTAPSVVGPLDGPITGPIAELRAWHPGQADLTVSGPIDGAPASCATPWTLHVVVR